MDKAQIQTKIETLEKKDKVLRDKLSVVRAKYPKPSKWMADKDYRNIIQHRMALEKELEGLYAQMGEIAHLEWLDRMAENYPDGQV